MCPVVRVCLGAAAAAEEMDAVVKCTICNAVVMIAARTVVSPAFSKELAVSNPSFCDITRMRWRCCGSTKGLPCLLACSALSSSPYLCRVSGVVLCICIPFDGMHLCPTRLLQGRAKERELSLVREVLSGLIGGALAALS